MSARETSRCCNSASHSHHQSPLVLVFVSPHLEAVVGVGTLTARGLAGGDAQHLGGHAHWALHLELLVLGALDQVAAHYASKGQGKEYKG